MGFGFRKSIKVIPGVRLNLSKSGVSTSIGGKGATVNVSKRGTKATLSIPGTGLHYKTKTVKNAKGLKASTDKNVSESYKLDPSSIKKPMSFLSLFGRAVLLVIAFVILISMFG